jgi:hypothetical protein
MVKDGATTAEAEVMALLVEQLDAAVLAGSR